MDKKKMLNKKVLLGGFAVVCAILVIAVCSFTPFIIDPSRALTAEFLSDELIVCAIVVFAIIAVMFIAQASNQADPKSWICKARAHFMETQCKIKDRSAFSQWVRKVLQPRDYKAIRERELLAVGIEDFTIVDLDRAQLQSLLEKPGKFGDRFYKTITKRQLKAILDVKDGKFYVKPVPPEYYLTYKGAEKTRTVTERSGTETKIKNATTAFHIVSKIVITLIPAFIFASMVRDMASEMTKAEAWMKFATRMMSFATSSFNGWLCGCKLNDIDASYIEMRCLVHEDFLQDADFKPKTQQELAKEEFAERVKEENQGILLLENTQGRG